MENNPSQSAYIELKAKKNLILERWKFLAQEKIQASSNHSTAALIDFLPYFLDQLIESLKTPNKHAPQIARKSISTDHGLQRAQLKHYTVDQVVAEYALLEEVILDVLHDDGMITAHECSIIARTFMDACSDAASAFVKSAEQSEIQFKRLVEEAKDIAILIIDTNGTIQTWNAGASRINQFSDSDVIGKNFRMLYRPEDRRLGRPEANLKEALTTGRHSEEWWRVKKDGSVWWAEVVLSAIHSPSGKVVGLCKIFHDLTEKKRIEDELRKAKVAAESANRLKSSFLANMSHEIRTPLGVILGISDILKEPELSPQQREELFRVVERNGKVLMRLIDDILDFTKIEAGKLDLHYSQVNVHNLLQDVINAFQFKVDEKHISLSLTIHPESTPIVRTDSIRLRQILSNLISNAIKFTEHGGVRVLVRSYKFDHVNGVEIVVSDTGTGIPRDKVGRIFGEFNQADSSVTRKYGGAGLGLAISRKLARELGGELDLVDCTEKVGCTFRLLVKDQQMADAVLNQPTSHSHYPHLKESKVLFIEDSQDDQRLVEQILSQFGVKVEIVPNGEEGVRRASKESFDAVLLDLHHQIGEGLRAGEELREHGFAKPIVAISDRDVEENTQNLKKCFNDYLLRPINSVELLNLLEKWMSEVRH